MGGVDTQAAVGRAGGTAGLMIDDAVDKIVAFELGPVPAAVAVLSVEVPALGLDRIGALRGSRSPGAQGALPVFDALPVVLFALVDAESVLAVVDQNEHFLFALIGLCLLVHVVADFPNEGAGLLVEVVPDLFDFMASLEGRAVLVVVLHAADDLPAFGGSRGLGGRLGRGLSCRLLLPFFRTYGLGAEGQAGKTCDQRKDQHDDGLLLYYLMHGLPPLLFPCLFSLIYFTTGVRFVQRGCVIVRSRHL